MLSYHREFEQQRETGAKSTQQLVNQRSHDPSEIGVASSDIYSHKVGQSYLFSYSDNCAWFFFKLPFSFTWMKVVYSCEVGILKSIFSVLHCNYILSMSNMINPYIDFIVVVTSVVY
jgi:hypothetical protein